MTIKIDKKIIGYSLKHEDEPAIASEPAMSHEDIARPDELRGYTYKIKPPSDPMYITINNIVLNQDTEHEQEYPFEVLLIPKIWNSSSGF